jgi:hypothetical protein
MKLIDAIAPTVNDSFADTLLRLYRSEAPAEPALPVGPSAEDMADYNQWRAESDAREFEAWMAAMDREAATRGDGQDWPEDEIVQAWGARRPY